MQGVLHPESVGHLRALSQWLHHCDSAAEIVKDHYSHLEGEDLLTAVAEENVLVQLEHLHSLPVIASRLSRGLLKLHAWMYKIETGEVFVYEGSAGQFRKLEGSTAQMSA
jgi:carbonic anhydrase